MEAILSQLFHLENNLIFVVIDEKDIKINKKRRNKGKH
jgi:hypothetical protein